MRSEVRFKKRDRYITKLTPQLQQHASDLPICTWCDLKLPAGLTRGQAPINTVDCIQRQHQNKNNDSDTVILYHNKHPICHILSLISDLNIQHFFPDPICCFSDVRFSPGHVRGEQTTAGATHQGIEGPSAWLFDEVQHRRHLANGVEKRWHLRPQWTE